MAAHETMAREQQQPTGNAVSAPIRLAVPPLENGDRLTRQEFERRYRAMPEVKKAELIEGVVYMASPVLPTHSRPHARLIGWLVVYEAATLGVEVHDNTTVRLDADNESQPDALLCLPPGTGGKLRFGDDGYFVGAPELAAEIAGSSASYDLGDKLKAYRRNGVQEYIVWQVYEQRLDWFHLHEGVYIPLQPDPNGIIQSQIFPGLWLDREAMLTGNLAQLLAVLQQGLATSEHAAFVEKLRATGS
jgi:Uma2 family endonuclease